MTKYCDGCGLSERDCICEPFEHGFTELQDSCPSCGAMWGFEEMEQGCCFACGYPDAEEDYDDDFGLPPELQHDGFYYTTPAGTPAHIQGDPNMSQEALDALSKIIDAAAKMIDDKPEEGRE